MVYNINVEFQIKQSNNTTIKQNGQDKKSESANPANPAKEEWRTDNEVGIEVEHIGDGESWTASSEAFKGDETPRKCEEGDREEIMEKTDG